MNETILVTGANGHIGANTVRSLLKKGYNVRAHVRKNADLRSLTGLPITYSYGDICDRDPLVKAAAGCNAIIHHAAVYKIWSKTADDVMRPALEGTENIFAAAAEAGVKRLVYTSSTYAVGISKNPKTILTEKDWTHNEYVPYGVAKTKSERLAWQLSERYNVPMIVLCPAAVYGRYDYKVTPSNRLPFDILKGRGMTVKGVLSIVDARDIGELHSLAVSKGNTGERYIASGGAFSMKEIGETTSRLSKRSVLHAPFARSMNIMTAGILETVAKFTGWDPPFTIGLAKEHSHRYAQFDNSKIIKDFNHTFYSLEDTIRDTIRWFCFSHNIRLNKRVADQFLPEPEWLAN